MIERADQRHAPPVQIAIEPEMGFASGRWLISGTRKFAVEKVRQTLRHRFIIRKRDEDEPGHAVYIMLCCSAAD